MARSDVAGVLLAGAIAGAILAYLWAKSTMVPVYDVRPSVDLTGAKLESGP